MFQFVLVVTIVSSVSVVYGGWYIHYPCVGDETIALAHDDEAVKELALNVYHFRIERFLPAHTTINITLVRKTLARHSALTIESTVTSQDILNVELKADHEVLDHILLAEAIPVTLSIIINGTEQCKELAEGNPVESLVPQQVNLIAPSEDDDDTLCGRRKVTATEIIVSGQETKPGDWPWHVGLYRLVIETSSVKYLCGGTLISSNTVLTSASGVSIRGVPRDPNLLTAILGKHTVVGSDSTSQDREIFEITIHENFNYTILLNDIAILKLKSEAVFNKYVQPACLWGKYDLIKYGDRKIEGTTVGWGFDENKKLSNKLKKAVMPIVEYIECVRSNPLVFSVTLNEFNFCAGFKNGTSTCNGDGGSGFFVFIPDIIGDSSPNALGSWHIRGITSTAVVEPKTKICDPFNYVLFTDVSKFSAWIQENK